MYREQIQQIICIKFTGEILRNRGNLDEKITKTQNEIIIWKKLKPWGNQRSNKKQGNGEFRESKSS